MPQTRRTRIITRTGTHFTLLEETEEVVAVLTFAKPDELVRFTSITGVMPPERVWLNREQIVAIQEVSAESDAWQERADELHYARAIQEMGPAENYTEAVREMVDVLKGEVEDDE
jgi:hypothetical protein